MVEIDVQIPPWEAHSQRVCRQGLGMEEQRHSCVQVPLRTYLLRAWENQKSVQGGKSGQVTNRAVLNLTSIGKGTSTGC